MDLYLRALNRVDNTQLWKRYSRLCQNIGLNQSYFILSFDCDTDEDIQVVWDVHSKLMDLGITPVYAVPGALLKRGDNIYGRIHETGSVFMNHGDREHTYFDKANNRHASCFFYHEQSKNELEDDIHLGHEILQQTLSITAKGFRTPHFGTFQSEEQLKFLYSTINSLGYSYSSSTMPYLGFKKGPQYKTERILEFPVTGIYSNPFSILDSWGFFSSPSRIYQPNDYLKEIRNLVEFSKIMPVFINIYADPSHVYNQDGFFESMKILSNSTINTNYLQMVKK